VAGGRSAGLDAVRPTLCIGLMAVPWINLEHTLAMKSSPGWNGTPPVNTAATTGALLSLIYEFIY